MLLNESQATDQNLLTPTVAIISGWLGGHAAIIGGVAEVGIGLTVTIGTAGILSEVGVPLTAAGITLAAATTGGFAGGVAAEYGNGYVAGHTGWRLAGDTAIGGVAGAVGGAVGAGVAGQFCPAAIEGWIASGVAGGAAGGAIEGGYQGYQSGGWGGVVGGALEGALTGGALGGTGALAAYGAFNSLGLLNGYACFIASTHVVDGINTANGELKASDGAENLLTIAKVHYRTKRVEKLNRSDYIYGRHENDPYGPLQPFMVEEAFSLTSYHLRILTLRSSDGREQVICTTDHHRISSLDGLWKPANEFAVGDLVYEGGGEAAMIVASRYEAHPKGVKVFTIRVAEAHTYLVRAEGFKGEPIWVHNSFCGPNTYQQNEIGNSFQIENPDGVQEIGYASAEEKGYYGIGRTDEEAPDFQGTEYLYPAGEGQTSIVRIKLSGNYYDDNIAANLAGAFEEKPIGYSWHHLDYDPVTGEGTLQLVEQAAHEATYPHAGGVAQYRAYTGGGYHP
jgi:hypothetical protein